MGIQMPPCDVCSKGPLASFLKTAAFQCHQCDQFSATGHTPLQSPCTKPPAPCWPGLAVGIKMQIQNSVLGQFEFQVKPMKKGVCYKALCLSPVSYITSLCLPVNSHLHVAHCMSQNTRTVLSALLFFLPSQSHCRVGLT